MKKTIILLLFLIPAAIVTAQNPIVGEWRIESVGVAEPLLLEFDEGGMITSAEFSEEESLQYDAEAQTFMFPELGQVKYTVENNKLQIYFDNVDESHPFVRQFIMGFGGEFQNEVEKQFVEEFQKALIQVLKTTPFMVGYRIRVQQ